MSTMLDRLRVISHFPGRLRVRAAKFRVVPSTGVEVASRLAREPGVTSATPSPVTGSLLIVYDPRRTQLEQLLSVVVAEGRLSGIDVDEEEQDVNPMAPVPGERVRQVFRQVDSHVRRQVSGKIDLRTGIPATLALLGLGSLLVRPFAGPQWYHLVYWSCNFFVHLNPRDRGASTYGK
jgi:hypothetical protein